jgi:hypothetical protein
MALSENATPPKKYVKKLQFQRDHQWFADLGFFWGVPYFQINLNGCVSYIRDIRIQKNPPHWYLIGTIINMTQYHIYHDTIYDWWHISYLALIWNYIPPHNIHYSNDTVGGCEILHHQPDGWNPNKIMGW